jgi:hypothetical protein
MLVAKHRGVYGHCGFLLVELAGAFNEYRRIGVCWIERIDWFDGIEPQVIILM